MKRGHIFMAMTLLLYSCLPHGQGHIDASEKVAAAQPSDTIQWRTNFKETVELAEEQNLPIILSFSGSDWCGWCMKLHKEVLDTPAFIAATKDKFLFVEVDFPQSKTLSKEIKAQNEALLQKFNVPGFPTIIVLSPNQKTIATSGYQTGGGAKYAEFLINHRDKAAMLEQALNQLKSPTFSCTELETLYKQAKELGRDDDASALLEKGLQDTSNTFFLREKYSALEDSGLWESQQARDVRKALVILDPNNEQGSQYFIAVVDFEHYSKTATPQTDSQKIITPFVNYLRRFGAEDKGNAWRMQMILAGFLSSKNRTNEALKYAEQAHANAPLERKDEIAQSVQTLRMREEIAQK